MQPKPPPLTRDEVAALADLDRACNGDSARSFCWWRGCVTESAEPWARRQLACNFAADGRGGGQRYFVGAVAFERSGFAHDGRPQWRLLTVFTEKRYRGEGIALTLLNGTPLSEQPHEVIADVPEANVAVQLTLRRCGWHGFPLTRLDGNGLIRFRADFEGEPEPRTSPLPTPKSAKKRKRKQPPPRPEGVTK